MKGASLEKFYRFSNIDQYGGRLREDFTLIRLSSSCLHLRIFSKYPTSIIYSPVHGRARAY